MQVENNRYFPGYEGETAEIGILIEAGSGGVTMIRSYLNENSGVILIGRPV